MPKKRSITFYLPCYTSPVVHKLTPGPDEFPVHPLFICEHEHLLEHITLQQAGKFPAVSLIRLYLVV